KENVVALDERRIRHGFDANVFRPVIGECFHRWNSCLRRALGVEFLDSRTGLSCTETGKSKRVRVALVQMGRGRCATGSAVEMQIRRHKSCKQDISCAKHDITCMHCGRQYS